MSEAPTDGTVVLVYSQTLGHVICFYDMGTPKEEYWSRWRTAWNHAQLAIEPIAWMPLPSWP